VRNRSNLLVLLGIAFFVVGGLIVYVVSKDDGDGGSSASAPGQTVVVVATHDIPAGAKADAEIENGGLKEKTIPVGALVPGAIQSKQALAGATLTNAIADGEQVLQTGVQQLKRGSKLEDGYEAVAVKLTFPQGGAGYLNAGDRINLYGVYPPGTAVKGATIPRAELLLTNVQVLDTNQTIPANGVQQDASTRATGQDLVLLLALRTGDVERVVFDTSFAQLYASRVNDDAAPAGPTGGQSGDSILAVEPNVLAQG
jgi:Flp pilus assembly protein CpaB